MKFIIAFLLKKKKKKKKKNTIESVAYPRLRDFAIKLNWVDEVGGRKYNRFLEWVVSLY